MKKFSWLTITISVLFLFSCRKEDCKICSPSQFIKLYGGTKVDGANEIITTADGGYLFAGWTLSNDGDLTSNHGREDAWVVKLDCNGKIQWQKTYGGSSTDVANSVVPASDGGYVVAGLTYSNDGDVSGVHGSDDVWVFKLDANGNMVWQKTYGGSAIDDASKIIAAADGGYVIAGNTTSNDGDVSGYHGNYDAWVFKIDKNGNKIWQKVLGKSEFDVGYSVGTTSDGGYVLVGSSYVTSEDAWVVKLDAGGNQLWQKTLGGSASDIFTSVTKGKDGSIVLAGFTRSIDGDVIGKHGGTGTSDAWLVKLDLSGNKIWQNTFGAAGITYQARSVVAASDGGYAIAGSLEFDAKTGANNALIIKTNAAGTLAWQRTFGGTGSFGDSFFSISLVNGWGYVLTGGAYSNNGDITGNHGSEDAWVVTIKE